jgi:hypothetical protein
MIARKDTILRVYSDTQTDPSRPAIGTVSGRLDFRVPGSSTWTPATRLNGPISPVRDFQINRGISDHTINFLIPSPFCTGNLDYRVRVYDSFHPGQPGYTSAYFQETIEFTELFPLRIRGVAIHYTGLGLNVQAPTINDLRAALTFAILKNSSTKSLCSFLHRISTM